MAIPGRSLMDEYTRELIVMLPLVLPEIMHFSAKRFYVMFEIGHVVLNSLSLAQDTFYQVRIAQLVPYLRGDHLLESLASLYTGIASTDLI